MIVGSATLTIVASMMISETPAESAISAPHGGWSEAPVGSLTRPASVWRPVSERRLEAAPGRLDRLDHVTRPG